MSPSRRPAASTGEVLVRPRGIHRVRHVGAPRLAASVSRGIHLVR